MNSKEKREARLLEIKRESSKIALIWSIIGTIVMHLALYFLKFDRLFGETGMIIFDAIFFMVCLGNIYGQNMKIKQQELDIKSKLKL